MTMPDTAAGAGPLGRRRRLKASLPRRRHECGDRWRASRPLAEGTPPDGWHEAGGVTLIALSLAGLVVLAGILSVDVGALAAGRAAAQTAADLAALAALTPGDGTWAARSRATADANGATLIACACTPIEATVVVRRSVPVLPGGFVVQVTARARAILPLDLAAPRQRAPPRRREVRVMRTAATNRPSRSSQSPLATGVTCRFLAAARTLGRRTEPSWRERAAGSGGEGACRPVRRGACRPVQAGRERRVDFRAERDRGVARGAALRRASASRRRTASACRAGARLDEWPGRHGRAGDGWGSGSWWCTAETW